jgi:predicted short-subunit dehydrogenase-like oxidoreductase (DUF2520 family)
MRELERETSRHIATAAPRPATPGGSPSRSPLPARIGVLGAGRLGTALAAALRDAGVAVDGPRGRGGLPAGDALILCVPDAEIPAAAEAVAASQPPPFVGHTSGATPLSALEPAERAGAEAFSLHPLQTFPGDPASGGVLARFQGAGCAVAGSTPAAVAVAEAIALRLGMEPFELSDDRRVAYHAAASVASNFLVTLQAAAEEMAGAAGLEADEARRLLAPLVRSTVENWAALGPERALTGPVARGDEPTVAAQRAAIEDVAPHLLELFDALVDRTRALASRAVAA